jgi:hypothetical protein
MTFLQHKSAGQTQAVAEQKEWSQVTISGKY